MKVDLNQLTEGCILSKDIFLNTSKPVLKQKTILTEKHLKVLRAFLIKNVDVEPVLSNGELYHPAKTTPKYDQQEMHEDHPEEKSLINEYLKAVSEYKKHFISWQNGKSVSFYQMRNLIDSLVTLSLKDPKETLLLYHYSTPEEYHYHHGISVGLLSALIAKRMKYNDKEIHAVALAGVLANCGMSRIPSYILKNANNLTAQELKQIRQHPIYSYQILKVLPMIKEETLLAVLQHHEREDGTGYPLSVSGKKLHPYSKIVALADTFHAMVSERPYRPKQSMFKVLEALNKEQIAKYDQNVLSALTNETARLSHGTSVRLTNHEIGQIVFVEKDDPTRPILKMEDGNILVMKDHRNLFVEDIVQ